MTTQSGVRKRGLQAAGPGQMPGSPVALGHLQQPSLYSQAAQLSLSPFRFMPAQPKARPDMSTDPALQPEDRSAVFGQSVVSPPAAHILPPSVPQLVTGSALATPPQLPYRRLESLHTLRRRFDLSRAGQSKSQELPFPGPPYPALAGIHLKPQMLFDPSLYRLHHPFRRRWTAYVDIAVIGIPAEPMSAPLQFSI